MAKTTGPLFSLTASGALGKTIVYSIWKGVSYVRTLVTPINVNSALQQAVRSALGVLAKAARAVLTAAQDTADPAVGSPFYVAAVTAAPAGQSWISYMQSVMYASFAAVVVEWGTVSAPDKAFYETEAGIQGLTAYTDKAGDAHTAGEQLFFLAFYAETVLDIMVTGGRVTPTTEAAVQAFGAAVGETVP